MFVVKTLKNSAGPRPTETYLHLNNNSEYRAFRLRWRSSHWHSGGRCQRKQKKSIDQRALQIGYEGIKSLRSLAMKNYLVTGGLLSLVESYNDNRC